MQNRKISKVAVGLAALVVLAAALLRFSEKSPQNTRARPAPSEPTVSETASSNSHSPGPSEAVVSALETEEVPGVDFDWRQTLTNQTTPPNLPREEVEKYLEHNRRNAASLLAACRALGDTNYLKEATVNFPNDGRVQLSVLARDVFPEDRRKWLDLFKASSPDNSLANYLSAREYLKNGETRAAVSELLEAAGKPGFQDYGMESKLDDEELNMAAGRSPIQARLSSSAWEEEHLPELASLKGLAQDMARSQQQYLSVGDNASAENLTKMGLTLASRLDSGDGAKFLIDQLVGRSVESILLRQLDPNASYDFLGGKTPNGRLAEMKEQKASFTALRQNFRDALPNMTEPELLSYTERQRISGELEAMRWLQQRRSSTSGPERP